MMQQFDDEKGKGRNLHILNMKEEEASSFYAQFQRWPKELQQECADSLRNQIAKKKGDFIEWILAIHSKENGLIGRMEVTSFDGKEAVLIIHIVDKDLASKYGIEVVKQFLKICKENHYFERIELEAGYVTAMYSKIQNSGSRIVEVA